jgi:hypothetical protein
MNGRNKLGCQSMGGEMNEIEKGRAVINRRVGRYLQAHPTRTYEAA